MSEEDVKTSLQKRVRYRRCGFVLISENFDDTAIQCKFCKRLFLQHNGFVRHLRNHTKELCIRLNDVGVSSVEEEEVAGHSNVLMRGISVGKDMAKVKEANEEDVNVKKDEMQKREVQKRVGSEMGVEKEVEEQNKDMKNADVQKEKVEEQQVVLEKNQNKNEKLPPNAIDVGGDDIGDDWSIVGDNMQDVVNLAMEKTFNDINEPDIPEPELEQDSGFLSFTDKTEHQQVQLVVPKVAVGDGIDEMNRVKCNRENTSTKADGLMLNRSQPELPALLKNAAEGKKKKVKSIALADLENTDEANKENKPPKGSLMPAPHLPEPRVFRIRNTAFGAEVKPSNANVAIKRKHDGENERATGTAAKVGRGGVFYINERFVSSNSNNANSYPHRSYDLPNKRRCVDRLSIDSIHHFEGKLDSTKALSSSNGITVRMPIKSNYLCKDANIQKPSRMFAQLFSASIEPALSNLKTSPVIDLTENETKNNVNLKTSPVIDLTENETKNDVNSIQFNENELTKTSNMEPIGLLDASAISLPEQMDLDVSIPTTTAATATTSNTSIPGASVEELLAKVGLNCISTPNFDNTLTLDEEKAVHSRAEFFSKVLGKNKIVWSYMHMSVNRNDAVAKLEAFSKISADINEHLKINLSVSDVKLIINEVFVWYQTLCQKQLFSKREPEAAVRYYYNLYAFLPKTSRFPIYCEFCDAEYLSKWDYEHHKRQTHQTSIQRPFVNGGPFRCMDCSQRYKTSKLLFEHSKSHLVQIFSCIDCSRIFLTYDELQMHKQANHRQ